MPPVQIPSSTERAEARASNRTPFADIIRAPRHLALDFSYNNDDRNDPSVKGIFKLYGSAQPKDGTGSVRQISLRNIVLAEIPGYAAIVRACTVPLNKLPVTSDFGGSWVFDVPAKSANPDVAEIYDGFADKVAIAFEAVGAILTYKSLTFVMRNGQREQVPALDANGNRLGRLGITGGADSVASVAPAGQAMRALLGGVPAGGVPSLEETSAGTPF